MKEIVELYLSRNKEFIEELEQRTPEEKQYDDFILGELRKGKSFKVVLNEAAQKYPEEALQVDDNSMKDAENHYDYLLKHEEIMQKMEEKQIQKVMKIISDWNPLGDRAATVPDLDGYETEAIDILSQIDLRPTRITVLNIVRTVLNQAFDLALDKNECIEPAKRIFEILKE